MQMNRGACGRQQEQNGYDGSEETFHLLNKSKEFFEISLYNDGNHYVKVD